MAEQTVQYTKEERVRRWLLYGVIPSFIPVILAISYDFIKFDFNIIRALGDHFLDFILVAFAMAVSIFTSAMDFERAIETKKRENYIVKSVGLGLLSILIYCVLYIAQNSLAMSVKYILFAIFLYVAYIDFNIGKEIEFATGQ